MAASQRELETSVQPLKRPTDYWTKAYRQSVSLNFAINFISQLMLQLPEEIGLFQGKASGDTLKIPKLPAALIFAYIHPYI